MAAAAEGEDDAEIPYELKFMWNYERFGNPWPDKGWMQWEAGLVRRAVAYGNIYNAFAERRRASKKSAWADANPQKNDIFTRVFKLRKEVAKRGDK